MHAARATRRSAATSWGSRCRGDPVQRSGVRRARRSAPREQRTLPRSCSDRAGGVARRPWRLITFMALLPGLTSTALMRRPTTSFSRSRLRTSISGSSGIPSPFGPQLLIRLEACQSLPRRVLLRLFLAAPFPYAEQFRLHIDVGRKSFVVIGARRSHSVRGEPADVADDDLLQRRLRVVTPPGLDARPNSLLEQSLQHRRNGGNPLIQIDGAHYCFQCVCKERRLVPANGTLFTFSKTDVASEMEFARQVRKRVGVDNGRAQPSHLSFVEFRITRVDQIRYYRTENRVAEELQPLVVIDRYLLFERVRAMCQS